MKENVGGLLLYYGWALPRLMFGFFFFFFCGVNILEN